ncbi:MAG: hypothetical protein ACUVTL_07755 [Thermoproteota archaeon]
MKDYLAACRFQTMKFGSIEIPRIILGHLPFVGESYQGQRKNEECAARFSDIRNTVRLLRLFVEKFGITVMSAGAMGGNWLEALLLKAIAEVESVTKVRIGLIPCVQIPLRISGKPVDVYRRWLTYYMMEREKEKNLSKKYLEDPILQCRKGWRQNFEDALKSSKPYSSDETKELEIDFEKLDLALLKIKDFDVLFVELGSESDFLAMTGRTDLLEELADHVLRKFDGVILGLHHAGSVIPILEESGIRFDGYVTPVNKLGVMMFPNTEEALDSIHKTKKTVIAIKPLAGGRIEPRSAFQYVFVEAKMGFSMVGVASEREAEEDLSAASEVLRGQI